MNINDEKHIDLVKCHHCGQEPKLWVGAFITGSTIITGVCTPELEDRIQNQNDEFLGDVLKVSPYYFYKCDCSEEGSKAAAEKEKAAENWNNWWNGKSDPVKSYLRSRLRELEP